MRLGEEPELPRDPAGLVAATYAAVNARDYDTLRLLCYPDFVFSCNVDPEKLNSPVQIVGPENIRLHLQRVRKNWEILQNEAGIPKERMLEKREPRERGYLYVVTLQIHIRNRHTGLEYTGTKRQEWLIQDGKISAMAEWLDCKQIDSMKREPDLVD